MENSDINNGVVSKVGLALIQDSRLLLVRRHNDPWLILPGGKPIAEETDTETLARESREELSCDIDRRSLRWVGEFKDELAGDRSRQVSVRLYSASLIGTPKPSAEIEELVWHPLDSTSDIHLAPSLRRHILPKLAVLARR